MEKRHLFMNAMKCNTSSLGIQMKNDPSLRLRLVKMKSHKEKKRKKTFLQVTEQQIKWHFLQVCVWPGEVKRRTKNEDTTQHLET